VKVCLSVIISINFLTILSLLAIAGGIYFFFHGFYLLARKRLLLATPTSKIRSAAFGLVEVNGLATGPHTIPAPISGKPCFLYRTTAWQQSKGKKDDWEKVADETLHLPFFVKDTTGELLIEPLGADLDLHRDFREEYDASFFSSTLNDVPPRVSVFLSRHGVIPARKLRIEEHSIKPDDPLFIAGTLTENPGVEVRPFSHGGAAHDSEYGSGLERGATPEVIRLESGATPSTSLEMNQQSKIAAALTRAGITKPEAWSAAGVPYQSLAVEQNAEEENGETEKLDAGPQDSNLTPPVVLMKGENDSTFVISFRSQKEFVAALGWKAAAMVWGGAAITLLGVYVLLAQMAVV
jgi:hypothetical protein